MMATSPSCSMSASHDHSSGSFSDSRARTATRVERSSARDHDPLPIPTGLHVLIADPRAHRGILEALAHREASAFVRPVRDRDREPGRGRRVRVLVGLDVEPRVARSFDLRGRVLHAAPVLRTRGLVVRQLHAHVRTPAYLEILLDGLDEAVALVSDMAGVKASFLLDDGAQ